MDRFREHPEFVDGAAWYWGEVLRRSTRSSWQHTPGDRNDVSSTMGYFWLHRPDAGLFFTPELHLAYLIELRDRRLLRTIFDNWRS